MKTDDEGDGILTSEGSGGTRSGVRQDSQIRLGYSVSSLVSIRIVSRFDGILPELIILLHRNRHPE